MRDSLPIVLCLSLGCGATSTAPQSARVESAPSPPRSAAVANRPAAAPPLVLPAAPWAEAPLAAAEVPPALMTAWRRADNRDACAPVSPRELGDGVGARARRATVEGGWSIEFDRPGAPGVGPDGRACPRCGRAAFGVVGADLLPEQAFGTEPTVGWRDGSRGRLELPASPEEPTAATISIPGQSCVYQVWSYLGEQHLKQMVLSLRFVETRRPQVAAAE